MAIQPYKESNTISELYASTPVQQAANPPLEARRLYLRVDRGLADNPLQFQNVLESVFKAQLSMMSVIASAGVDSLTLHDKEFSVNSDKESLTIYFTLEATVPGKDNLVDNFDTRYKITDVYAFKDDVVTSTTEAVRYNIKGALR